MKYMLLIYDDEKAWASFSESQRQGYMGEYRQFTEAIKASGNHVSGSQLRETAAATKVQLRAGKRASGLAIIALSLTRDCKPRKAKRCDGET